MRILTAYGYTEPISPECGAWGQEAVESPIGWLAFMCWMSAYVEHESTDPYEYTTNNETLKVTKLYMQTTERISNQVEKGHRRYGMQWLILPRQLV